PLSTPFAFEPEGLAGFQIVPRFATFVYYNCRTSDVSVSRLRMGAYSRG
ncbi:unnamed protein product, partial [Ectocarpus sp. 8 AP-2014]